MKFKLFRSSVQKEFAKERRAIASYIRKDAVFGLIVNAICHRDCASHASV